MATAPSKSSPSHASSASFGGPFRKCLFATHNSDFKSIGSFATASLIGMQGFMESSNRPFIRPVVSLRSYSRSAIRACVISCNFFRSSAPISDNHATNSSSVNVPFPSLSAALIMAEILSSVHLKGSMRGKHRFKSRSVTTPSRSSSKIIKILLSWSKFGFGWADPEGSDLVCASDLGCGSAVCDSPRGGGAKIPIGLHNGGLENLTGAGDVTRIDGSASFHFPSSACFHLPTMSSGALQL
mmetsp:Transcript_22449/g.62799  ORF Transcript_22449/g.62799 Transcript_22449/m.62799 type:complete len:241 (-) Transcript_22449:360-1082(-)